MRCNTCGMDSKRTDACDFCGSRLGAATSTAPPAAPPPGLGVTQQIPQPPLGTTQAFAPPPGMNTTQAFAPQQPQIRVSLTGEAVAVDAPPAIPMPPVGQMQAQAYGPTMPAAPRIFNPSAGLPAAAVGVSLASSMTRDRDRVTVGARWELTLAIFLPIMALSVLMIKIHPSTYNWLQFVGFFTVGMALGAPGVIPVDAEAFMDWAVVLLLCFFFGPAIALVVYLIAGVLRQSWNSAVIMLLLGNCVVTVVLATALVSATGIMGLITVSAGMFTRFFGVVTTMVGWSFSTFFRPINED